MDALWLWYAAAAAAAALCLLWTAFTFPAGESRATANLPPGPRGLPVVGNLLQLGMKPKESLAALAAKHGPLMTLRLGMRTTIVVSSPAMAKEILKTQDNIFAGRTVPHTNEALGHCNTGIVFAQQGPHLRMLRRVSAMHLFTPKQLQSLQPLRHLKLVEMLQHVLLCCCGGQERLINVGETVLQCTANLMGNMVFGRDMFDPQSQAKQLQQFKKTSREVLLVNGLPNIADFFSVVRPLDPQRLYCRAFNAFTDFYRMLDGLIHDTLQLGNSTSLLSALLQGSNDDISLTIPKIRAYLLDIFLAGTDTAAVTVEWAMAELMKNPEVMQKAKQEMDTVVGRHRLVQEEDIERLPYLGAVVKETFRLHPAAPLLIPHRADQAAQVCGYHIPRHAQVIINVWAIGRDPAVWTEPQSFQPQRFVGSKIDFRGQHFELIPFGSGRRMCVGMALAAKMIHITLARLLQCFDWSLPRGFSPAELDMSDVSGLTMEKAQPLLLHPSPRLPLHLYSPCEI